MAISILALLLLLSFPAVGYFRDQGRKVECVQNLRTLGNAILQYTQDHQQRFPPSVELNWPGPLFGKDVPQWGPTWFEYLAKHYLAGEKIYARCPARPSTWGAKGYVGYYPDYAYNGRLCPLDSTTNLYMGIKLQSVRHPSRTILLADGGRLSGGQMVGGYYEMKDAYRLHPRHRGGTVMVLYVDQHVEAHHYTQTGALPPVTDPLGANAFIP